MVIFDTNALALYFSRSLSPDDTLRMDGLLAELRKRREPIGIPTPVLAEFLAKPNPAEMAGLNEIQASSAFKILPYDAKAAYETAEMAQQSRSTGRKSKNERPRQAVKVDRQIIAIAKSSRARLLITNDTEMKAEAERSGILVKSISDLSIPDGLRQQALALPSPMEANPMPSDGV